MKVVLGILIVAGAVAVVLVGGHYALTVAAKQEGEIASAAQSTCGWCHNFSGDGSHSSETTATGPGTGSAHRLALWMAQSR